jgi:uroporphyrinogen-III synthase
LLKNGFKIEFIGENVENIISFIKENVFSLKNEKIMYLRGNYISFDIANYLKDTIRIEEFYAYNIKYKSDFSEQFINDLISGFIKQIAFFSYKSVDEFFQICIFLKIEGHLSKIKIFVMNEKSKSLIGNYCNDITISTAQSLVESIKKFLNR